MAANWRLVIAPLVILSFSLVLVLSCPSRSFLLLRNLPSRSTALADPAQQAAFQPEHEPILRRGHQHDDEHHHPQPTPLQQDRSLHGHVAESVLGGDDLTDDGSDHGEADVALQDRMSDEKGKSVTV